MRMLLGACAVVTALALPTVALGITDPELDYHGLRYACTGLAAESRDDPRWRSYSTKLVFATASGSYLANIGVTIIDDSDLIVLEARCLSPWLMVDLAPGHYRVEAIARDSIVRKFDLTVPGGRQIEYTVRYQEIAN
jgi:hypothetical protein